MSNKKIHTGDRECWIHRCYNEAMSTVVWRGIPRRMCETHNKTYGTSVEKCWREVEEKNN